MLLQAVITPGRNRSQLIMRQHAATVASTATMASISAGKQEVHLQGHPDMQLHTGDRPSEHSRNAAVLQCGLLGHLCPHGCLHLVHFGCTEELSDDRIGLHNAVLQVNTN